MKIRNVITGGDAVADDALAKKLVESGLWEAVDTAPKKAPAKKAAPKKPDTPEE